MLVKERTNMPRETTINFAFYTFYLGLTGRSESGFSFESKIVIRALMKLDQLIHSSFMSRGQSKTKN